MTGPASEPQQGMPIVRAAEEAYDRVIRDWVRTVDAGVELSLDPPVAGRSGRGVSTYLLELAPHPPPRGVTRAPLQLWLRYLVTTWADGPAEAHRLLLDLAFAGMERQDLELDIETLPAATWAALGALPQPSFLVRVAARRERPQPPAKPVLLPLRVEGGDLGAVGGVVLDPREQPVADAVVAVPGLDRAVRTDRRGRFLLRGIPGPPLTKQLLVRAKGRELVVAVPDDRELARSMVIHLDPLEGEHG